MPIRALFYDWPRCKGSSYYCIKCHNSRPAPKKQLPDERMPVISTQARGLQGIILQEGQSVAQARVKKKLKKKHEHHHDGK